MKKTTSLMLIALLMLSIIPFSVSAKSGPSGVSSYISLAEDGKTYKSIYNATNQDLTTISGVSYDRDTNTLTLNNYNQKLCQLDCNEMGDNFKIKVVGKNYLQTIRVWGFGYGGSVKFVGNGELTINQDKIADFGIALMAEDSDSTLSVSSETTVKVYSSTANAVCISGTTINNGAISTEGVIDNNLTPETTSYQMPKTVDGIDLSAFNEIDSYKKADSDKIYAFVLYQNWNEDFTSYTEYYKLFEATYYENAGYLLTYIGDYDTIPSEYTKNDLLGKINCLEENDFTSKSYYIAKKDNKEYGFGFYSYNNNGVETKYIKFFDIIESKGKVFMKEIDKMQVQDFNFPENSGYTEVFSHYNYTHIMKSNYVGFLPKGTPINPITPSNPTTPTNPTNPTSPTKPSTTKPTTVSKVVLKTPKIKIISKKKFLRKKYLQIKYTSVKNAVGFQVRYKVKGKWIIKTFNTKKSTTVTIKKLKKGKCKIQVRAFSKGKKSFSKWTAVKTVKI